MNIPEGLAWRKYHDICSCCDEDTNLFDEIIGTPFCGECWGKHLKEWEAEIIKARRDAGLNL